MKSTQPVGSDSPGRKNLLTLAGIIVIAAFAVRMAVLVRAQLGAPLAVRVNLPYGFELGSVAASIASGHGFSSPLRWFPTGPTAWFGPIYPYLGAGIFKLFGVYSYSSYLVLETINAALSALTCIPIFLVGKRTFGAGVGAASACAWAILPVAVMIPLEWIWDTAFSALCMMLILYATLLLRDHPRALNWAAYGVLWAFGALLNPSLLAVLPFLLAWIIWDLQRRRGIWLPGATAFVLLFALGLAPWTIRNEIVFHKFIPLRSNFGLELWLGNNAGTVDNDSSYEHPDDNIEEAKIYRTLGEPAYMSMKLHEAVDFIRSHPADAATLTFHRVVATWLGTWDPLQDSWRAERWTQRAFVMFTMVFSLLALLGALLAIRSQNYDAIPFALAILSYPLVFYATHGSPRYRHPIDPILTILVVYALGYPVRLWRGSKLGHPRSRASRPTPMEPLTP